MDEVRPLVIRADSPGGSRIHLHFMGRAHGKTNQIRGQNIDLFLKGHRIYKEHIKHLTEDQMISLRKKVDEILREPKYVKMAEITER